MAFEKLICLILFFTQLEVVVKTQKPNNGNTRDFIHHHNDIHSSMVNNLMLSSEQNEDIKNLVFQPDLLDFFKNPVGDPQNQLVTLYNKHENQSVFLGSITGRLPDFYSSFFEDKVIPAGMNTTFNVVFLPRQHGTIQSSLLIHTSFGLLKFNVKGEGVECPYRLTPLVGLKVPLNATLTPEISMYNPHSVPLQIIEVYSSGGQFQLELPSGGQEGPQALWEIPPYCTKPIIRIKFTASTPGNHTAYVRIKISGNDPGLSERMLVVPIEVEILQETGLYSAIPFIDFGLIGSDDSPANYKLNLTNSGESPVEINDWSIEGLSDYLQSSISIKLKDKLLLVTTNWSQIEQTQYLNGNILINTNFNQQTLIIPFSVKIIKGSIEYSDAQTKFLTTIKNFNYKTQSDFIVKNKYDVPLTVTNITVKNSNYFKIIDFNKKTIQPGESVNLFKISLENSMNHPNLTFSSNFNIITNLTNYQIPIIITNGKFRRLVPVESDLSKSSDEKILNFGTLQVSTQSSSFLGLINDNPIDISIKHWKGTVTNGAGITIILRGCGNLTMENLVFCHVVKPGEWILFQISVQSNLVGNFNGKFLVETDYEELITPIKFTVAMGRLELNPELLHFKDCFPDKQCYLNLTAHSTFLKKMKVEGISVDLPGITYEFTEEDEFPEILPNIETDIGRLYFDSKSICDGECYTGLKAFENPIGIKWMDTIVDYSSHRKLDNELLTERMILYKKMKSKTKTISFKLATNQIRKFEFNATIDFVWPKLIPESINFPVLQTGHEVIKFITINNPSDQLVILHYVLHDMSLHGSRIDLPGVAVSSCPQCSLTNKSVFSFPVGKQYKYGDFVNPKSSAKIAIVFSAETPGTYSTLLYVRNNLTIVEAVWITAKAVLPQFKFGSRKPGSTTALLFNIDDKHLRDCDRKLTENVEAIAVSTKRVFTARNVGEVPIRIGEIKIGGKLCEGFGFKIMDCSPFDLSPNGSKKIEIAFTPDFTLARVVRMLELETSMGYSVNYTLLSTIPPHALGPCGKALLRPDWESTLKISLTSVLAVVFIFSLIAAFLDADKCIKDHLHNLSRDRGPLQPTLDLRQIGLRSPDDHQPIQIINNNSPQNNNKNTNFNQNVNKKKINLNKKQEDFNKKSWTSEFTAKLSNVKPQVLETIRSTTKSVLSTTKSSENKNRRRSVTPPTNNKIIIEQKKKEFCKSRDEEETSSTTTESSVHSEESDEKLSPPIIEETKIESAVSQTVNGSNCDIRKKNLKTAVKKTRSLPVNYGARDDAGQPQAKTSKPNINCSSNNKNTRNNASSSNSSGSECQSLNSSSGVSLNDDSNSPEPKKTTAYKKYGKTPGRERKAAQGSKKSSNKSSNIKGTALQFTQNQTNNFLANMAPSIWDENRASFSYVVAQSKPINPDPAIPNYNQLNLPNENLSNAALQCIGGLDLSSHPQPINHLDENKFVPVMKEEKKRSSVDLGPIGTRKSPSSTPVWEPIPPSIQRPKPLPNMPNSLINSNSFFSGHYTRQNNYGPSELNQFPQQDNQNVPSMHNHSTPTELLGHLIAENNRVWGSNLTLLSLLSQQQIAVRSNEPENNISSNGWGDSSNTVWSSDSFPTAPSSVSSWPQGPLRPPPGFDLARERQQDNQEDGRHSMPQFDPFNSLSSIWSNDAWTPQDPSRKNNPNQ